MTKLPQATPQPLPQPDFTALGKLCQEYMKELADGTYHEDNDSKAYIFEAAIEAIYGKDVWKWINKRIV